MKIDSFDRFNSEDDFCFEGSEDKLIEDDEIETIREKEKKMDNGYFYLLNIANIIKNIKSVVLIKEDSRVKLDKCIETIEQDFKDLIRYISDYVVAIKVSKNRNINEYIMSEERRRLAHNNLMSSIEKTIRDIKFNFDESYDINGKNFIFKQKYLANLKPDQEKPDFLESNEIEKIKFKNNLFLPDAFNDSSMPNYKYLSDRRIYITQWAEDIYHSDIISDKEKINRLLE